MTGYTMSFYILRATADPLRGERLNAGFVAFPKERAPIVRMATDSRMLQSLLPAIAASDLSAWAESLSSALESVDPEHRAAMLPMIVAPFIADDRPGTLATAQGDEESAADFLLRRITTPLRLQRRKQSGERASKLETEIRQALRRVKLFSNKTDDLSKGRVVGQYPIDPGADLYADFALKNGKIHVIETLDLRGVDHLTAGLRGHAALKSITLAESSEKLRDNAGRKIAVISASDYSVARPAIKLISRAADDVWDMNAAGGAQQLWDFISDSLHADLDQDALSFGPSV